MTGFAAKVDPTAYVGAGRLGRSDQRLTQLWIGAYGIDERLAVDPWSCCWRRWLRRSIPIRMLPAMELNVCGQQELK